MIPDVMYSIQYEEQDNLKSLPALEEKLIYGALKENYGSIKRTAQKLGISYKTLQYRIKKYGFDKNQFKQA